MQVASTGPEVGGIIRNFGEDLTALQHAVAINGIDAEINQVKFEAKQFATAAACANGVIGGTASGAATGGYIGAAVGAFVGGLGCMTGFSELGFIERIRDLENEKLGEQRGLIISQYSQRFADHAAALERQTLALTEALEEVSRKLGEIESLRQGARRAVNDSVWAMSKRNHGPVTEVMKQRRETARIRYEQSFDNAKQMAFLAKRAIEQRLGMKLADLREDLPLVAAPQSWEGTVCATTGIDYNALRKPGDDKPNNFADAFIGDYVTKLENVVEAYRLRYNFHEGADTAVVSLRDDVLNVREKCVKESDNLLFHSGDFALASVAEGQDPTGWQLRGAAEPQLVPPPASSSRIGWWPLDDGQDATALGNHLSGTGLESTEGMVGAALAFDGTHCLTSSSTNLNLAGATGITMMAWVKPDTAVDSYGYVLSRDDWDFFLNAGYQASQVGTFVVGNVRAQPFDDFLSTTMFVTESPGWALAAVSWELNGNYRVYANDGYAAGQSQPIRVEENRRNLSIGCLFHGAIDEVSLYKSALPPDAIDAYYRAVRDAAKRPIALSRGQPVVVVSGLDPQTLTTHEVRFGSPSPTDGSNALPRGLVQRVALGAGRYRFSWHAPTNVVGHSLNRSNVRSISGAPIKNLTRVSADRIPVAGNGWSRPFLTFDLDGDATVEVGWEAGVDDNAFSMQLAGAMLERVDSPDPDVPVAYEETTHERNVERAVCQDTDGSIFRSAHWTPGCVNLCPDGFSSDCGNRTVSHCYHETSFNISQRAIEAGQELNLSGFARGNFNYRIQSIGLNFVGSGLRDCSDSDLPTTCNAAGYVPYSLTHEGPYMVRNHKGDDYRALLFTGHIEHARGLGTERYLTNPLGSADSELVGQYLRTELKGRPLDGQFVLRVWDEPNLDFSKIEDVQLVFKYGYWTRFD
jgi:hypothetical protein